MPPYQTTWDLRRAYVDFGDMERSPVALRAGRQDLSFGYGRLLGAWRNASRGYDAATLVLRWQRLCLNAFSASQVATMSNGLSHHTPGNNLHGLYVGLRNVIPNSNLEPHVFWRLSPDIKTEVGRLSFAF